MFESSIFFFVVFLFPWFDTQAPNYMNQLIVVKSFVIKERKRKREKKRPRPTRKIFILTVKCKCRAPLYRLPERVFLLFNKIITGEKNVRLCRLLKETRRAFMYKQFVK
ncbi:hypothetical protein CI102_14031 [Trichoderma harzianum]|nr:hypothetical protein CI102_14031 [Trichoderma harzianum]